MNLIAHSYRSLLASASLATSALVAGQTSASAQSPSAPGMTQAAADAQRQLEQSLAELAKLRETIAAEKVPLSRSLSELESELTKVRADYQQRTRAFDSRTLDLSNLRNELKARQDETAHLANLLSEYARNFEARLHIAELQRHGAALQSAKLAAENTALPKQELFAAQAALLSTSLDRLLDATDGARFPGTAVEPGGLVTKGHFLLIGPTALFRADDGKVVGSVQQRLGSLEPSVVPFEKPLDAAAAAQVVNDGRGSMPLDPTLGNAHKIEAIQETLVEHVGKGGVVMYPILALAGVALLVALYKWIAMMFVRKASRTGVAALLKAVARCDQPAATTIAAGLRGPGGRMLRAGVAHVEEPRELIEEVMYEDVLDARLRLQRLLPFIAITASSAPLLGLLGTVTGIMETFSLMTVFGTGDSKSLSSGISSALITTEWGLYVAIPALLLYAFLSRKARTIVDGMEKDALAFLNQVSKSYRTAAPSASAGEPDHSGNGTTHQVRAALADLLAPIVGRGDDLATSHGS